MNADREQTQSRRPLLRRNFNMTTALARRLGSVQRIGNNNRSALNSDYQLQRHGNVPILSRTFTSSAIIGNSMVPRGRLAMQMSNRRSRTRTRTRSRSRSRSRARLINARNPANSNGPTNVVRGRSQSRQRSVPPSNKRFNNNNNINNNNNNINNNNNNINNYRRGRSRSRRSISRQRQQSEQRARFINRRNQYYNVAENRKLPVKARLGVRPGDARENLLAQRFTGRKILNRNIRDNRNIGNRVNRGVNRGRIERKRVPNQNNALQVRNASEGGRGRQSRPRDR